MISSSGVFFKNKRLWIAIISGLLVLTAVIAQAMFRPLSPLMGVHGGSLPLDLSKPDAVLQSESLRRLPADVLKSPWLKPVLTEALVDYYENNEARLSLKGTLRRLAFEHDLSWPDQVLAQVLDSPAEVALWRDKDGKLSYWLLVMQRNTVGKLLQGVANIALSDAQLKKVAKLSVDGDEATVYALSYSNQRTLLLVSHGDRLVVASEPALLLDSGGKLIGKRQDVFESLLSKSKTQTTLLERFALRPETRGQHVTVAADFLAFGYQPFFPGVEALRFDFDNTQWQTQALLRGETLPPSGWDASPIWRAMPGAPAACAALPIQWQQAQGLLGEVGAGKQAAKALVEGMSGPLGVCWYGKSQLQSPLFVATARDAATAQALAPTLAKLFAQVIGAGESKHPEQRFPVVTSKGKSVDKGAVDQSWRRVVSARYGNREADGKLPVDGERYFQVSMALSGKHLLFSPDSHLVDNAVATLASKFPPLADSLNQPATTVISLYPASLSRLLEAEALRSLPRDQEPIFRNAAQQHLLPKLKALAKQAPQHLVLPNDIPKTGLNWVAATWQNGR